MAATLLPADAAKTSPLDLPNDPSPSHRCLLLIRNDASAILSLLNPAPKRRPTRPIVVGSTSETTVHPPFGTKSFMLFRGHLHAGVIGQSDVDAEGGRGRHQGSGNVGVRGGEFEWRRECVRGRRDSKGPAFLRCVGILQDRVPEHAMRDGRGRELPSPSRTTAAVP